MELAQCIRSMYIHLYYTSAGLENIPLKISFVYYIVCHFLGLSSDKIGNLYLAEE